MKRFFLLLVWLCFVAIRPVYADADHDMDAQSVEIDVIKAAPIADAPEWQTLTVLIANPFTVPIVLRDIRTKSGKVILEKSTSVFGNVIWSEQKMLRLSGGEAFVTDNATFRLSVNVPWVAGEMVPFELDFGPIGVKTFFYRIPNQTKP